MISASSCHIGLGSNVNSGGSFHGAVLCCTNMVESRMGMFRATSEEVCCNIAVERERQVCSNVEACVQRIFNLCVRSSERSWRELRMRGISW